jgi:FkbM family methyltransferase
MSFFRRVFNRLKWVFSVSFRLGAGIGHSLKMIFGGIWFLITDSGKSTLTFSAKIHSFGKTYDFKFQDLSDFGLFYEIFLDNNYPLDHEENIKTIFDVGANIGVSTIFFSLKYPEAQIFSFEPDPANLKRLHENAKKLGNVTVNDIAVWSEQTELTFYADPHRGSSSSALKIRDRQKKITVKASTLDQIIKETGVKHVDILKIDIEGAEEKAFSTWQHTTPIRFILGEIHGDLCNTDNVLDRIKPHYNSIELIPFNEGKRHYIIAANK